MRFKKKREEEITIGIAPLVDIVFLLLLFFAISYHFDIASGVQISLPKMSKTISGDEDENRVTLIIDKSAQIYLEGQKMDLKTLQERLQGYVREQGLIRLVLQADKDVSHGSVVEVMDVAKTAGVYSIIIAARWKPKG
ncbi:MAG TPA: biopolymer transporter ExbD [Desulfatiglandales bacterium]|nr:biopolymer transporter ExbD [Desulfatiglandales bacterium]